MKKISTFWKVYITILTVFIILGGVFMLFLSKWLTSYEAQATVKRETEQSERLAEQQAALESRRVAAEESEYTERNRLERESLIRADRQTSLSKASRAAAYTSLRFLDICGNVTPENAVKAFVARLNSEGSAALADICGVKLSPYEKPDAVIRYFDSVSGEYTYELVSLHEAKLYKGDDKIADLKLTEISAAEFGLSFVTVSEAVCDIVPASITVTCPEDGKLFINGLEVTDKPELYTEKILSGIPSKYNVPKTALYTLDGFISAAVVSATAPDGATLPAARAENVNFAFSPLKNEYYEKALSERLLTLAYRYSDFIAGDYQFDGLKPYMLRSTDLYGNLAYFDNRWYFGFADIDNGNATVTDFTVYSDTIVYAKLEYTQYLYREDGSVTRRIPISLEIVAVCTGETGIPIPDITETGEVTDTAPVTETVPVTDTPTQTAASTDTNTDTSETVEIPPDELPYAQWLLAEIK